MHFIDRLGRNCLNPPRGLGQYCGIHARMHASETQSGEVPSVEPEYPDHPELQHREGECNICLDSKTCNVLTCHQDHLLCQECLEKMNDPRCPTCRADLVVPRSTYSIIISNREAYRRETIDRETDQLIRNFYTSPEFTGSRRGDPIRRLNRMRDLNITINMLYLYRLFVNVRSGLQNDVVIDAGDRVVILDLRNGTRAAYSEIRL